MNVLRAQNLVWVSAEIIRTAGVTEFLLPLYRPKGSARSSLMHVSNERALRAGLMLTSPEVTVRDTRDWLKGSDLTPALSSELEAELIRIAQRGGKLTNRQIS